MSNPWSFSNADKNLESPDGICKIALEHIHELAMSAPLTAIGYLIIEHEKIKISDYCGGPVVWDRNGRRVAIPIWTAQLTQQIAVVDVDQRMITTYRKKFSVLHLTDFTDNHLIGSDGPSEKCEKINFSLANEEKGRVKMLTYEPKSPDGVITDKKKRAAKLNRLSLILTTSYLLVILIYNVLPGNLSDATGFFLTIIVILLSITVPLTVFALSVRSLSLYKSFWAACFLTVSVAFIVCMVLLIAELSKMGPVFVF